MLSRTELIDKWAERTTDKEAFRQTDEETDRQTDNIADIQIDEGQTEREYIQCLRNAPDSASYFFHKRILVSIYTVYCRGPCECPEARHKWYY